MYSLSCFLILCNSNSVLQKHQLVVHMRILAFPSLHCWEYIAPLWEGACFDIEINKEAGLRHLAGHRWKQNASLDGCWSSQLRQFWYVISWKPVWQNSKRTSKSWVFWVRQIYSLCETTNIYLSISHISCFTNRNTLLKWSPESEIYLYVEKQSSPCPGPVHSSTSYLQMSVSHCVFWSLRQSKMPVRMLSDLQSRKQ